MDIVSLIIGAIIGAVPSWFISKAFSKKSSTELQKALNKLRVKNESATTINSFNKMLFSSNWKKEHIGIQEIWTCENNSLFQIRTCEDDREFTESWTSSFRDNTTTKFHIHLIIGETVVKTMPFICADGGRYILPLPEQKIIDGTPMFYWTPGSVEVKVSEIVGKFNTYDSIADVAAFLGIEIHTVTKQNK